MRVSAIIPAYNEAPTVGKVVATLRQVPLVDEIIVVNDGSWDDTAEVARRQGAIVIDLKRNHGKGKAMLKGAHKARGEILLFLDADLEGLTPSHVEELLRPVLNGEADMTVGVFRRGRSLTDWAQVIAPYLSGQRAIPKKLFLAAGREATGFEIEVMLSRFAREKGWRVKRVPLANMTHVMKEEKRGLARGVVARLGMYKDIATFFWRQSLKKRKFLRPALWLLFLLGGIALLGYDISHTRVARAASRQLGDLPLSGMGERILIISPHPDDEVLAAGGLIARAKSEGASVHVVFLTNGDGFRRGLEAWNGLLPPDSGDFLAYGNRRQEEASKALAILGVPPEDITFLGYPDGGLGKIWWAYWSTEKPYRSPTTHSRAVPYATALSPGAVYSGINILADLLRVIKSYQPTVVLLPDTADSHPDHWATGAFTLAALAAWEREGGGEFPKVYSYLVHSGAWQLAPALHRNAPLLPPSFFLYRGTSWYKLPLDENVLLKKKQALDEYKTQKEVMGTFFANFLRPNEIFSYLQPKSIIGNGAHLVALDPPKETFTQRLEKGGDLRALYLDVRPQSMGVKVVLWEEPDPKVTYRVGLYVWGEQPLEPPARYIFEVPPGKKGEVKWREKPVHYTGSAWVSYEDKALRIELKDFPLFPGNYLMLEAETWISQVPLDRISWQLVEIRS
ncbi:N-acetylglucosaminyl deacetylase, LmbE family [Thermanaeromonas toyohensis ToBE]|uniref:Glucosyl-3-phosphoglycerate synthase n=1 Tax=Thermanaeromonas toyohensis ToBE TaxID=698762 RepID=A0A1W1VGF9_9FIRM|nr:PIG-L family deacetylase [Thermanaeromonas toyohensis]SMB92310.1 N-acetylglucosaminyl deacetylase, LmbE family [Thermanaeromonas toyohensis ToBE]